MHIIKPASKTGFYLLSFLNRYYSWMLGWYQSKLQVSQGSANFSVQGQIVHISRGEPYSLLQLPPIAALDRYTSGCDCVSVQLQLQTQAIGHN